MKLNVYGVLKRRDYVYGHRARGFIKFYYGGLLCLIYHDLNDTTNEA